MKKRADISRFFFDEIDSTNSWIKREINSLKNKIPFSVRARSQTKGRGRESRIWYSEKDSGLYTSFCIKIKNPEHLSLLSLTAGVACTKLIREIAGQKAFLKWPNDIICSEGKISGILVENLIKGADIISILGIGINLNNSPDSLKNKSVNKPAVSLKLLTGRNSSPEDIYYRLEDNVFDSLNTLEQEPDKIIRIAGKFSSPLVGKPITFHINSTINEGIFEGLSDSGEAVINIGGKKKNFLSGEMEIEK